MSASRSSARQSTMESVTSWGRFLRRVISNAVPDVDGGDTHRTAATIPDNGRDPTAVNVGDSGDETGGLKV